MTETTNIQAVEPVKEITQGIEPIEDKKAYTLRSISAKDVAPVTSILTKIGFREFKDLLNSPDLMAFINNLSADNKSDELDDSEIKVGLFIAFDIVGIIMANYGKCQDLLFEWLADLSGKTAKEIGELDLDVFTEMLFDVINKKEFKGFIKVVSKLFK